MRRSHLRPRGRCRYRVTVTGLITAHVRASVPSVIEASAANESIRRFRLGSGADTGPCRHRRTRHTDPALGAQPRRDPAGLQHRQPDPPAVGVTRTVSTSPSVSEAIDDAG